MTEVEIEKQPNVLHRLRNRIEDDVRTAAVDFGWCAGPCGKPIRVGEEYVIADGAFAWCLQDFVVSELRRLCTAAQHPPVFGATNAEEQPTGTQRCACGKATYEPTLLA